MRVRARLEGQGDTSARRRAALRAFLISGPLIVLVFAARTVGSDASAHAGAFVAIILGLPWVVPAFVAVAVLSAPIYVALHIGGFPQDLMPWLSAVILIGGLIACHLNATLLLQRLGRAPARAPDGGLAEFLGRPATRIAGCG